VSFSKKDSFDTDFFIPSVFSMQDVIYRRDNELWIMVVGTIFCIKRRIQTSNKIPDVAFIDFNKKHNTKRITLAQKNDLLLSIINKKSVMIK